MSHVLADHPPPPLRLAVRGDHAAVLEIGVAQAVRQLGEASVVVEEVNRRLASGDEPTIRDAIRAAKLLAKYEEAVRRDRHLEGLLKEARMALSAVLSLTKERMTPEGLERPLAGNGGRREPSSLRPSSRSPSSAPIIRFFHSTSQARATAILGEGFRDGAGTYGFGMKIESVYLADVPVDGNEGTLGEVVIGVVFDDSTDMSDYAIVEDDRPEGTYLEWIVPAAVINEHASVRVLDELEADQAWAARWAAAEAVIRRMEAREQRSHTRHALRLRPRRSLWAG